MAEKAQRPAVRQVSASRASGSLLSLNKFAPLLLLVSMSSAPADPLLFSWNFNEDGGSRAENHGSAGPASLILRNAESQPAELFTADGTGATGKPGDRAFDLSAATGMGAEDPPFQGPSGMVHPSEPGLATLSGLTSFTITGWFKPAGKLVGAARILVTGLFGLQAGNEHQIQLSINDGTGKPIHLTSDPAYSFVDSWMFFAVTYDGLSASDNVHFYIGAPAAGGLEPAGTGSIHAGPLGAMTGSLLVGNNSPKGIRPYQGLLDDLAIYGSTTDSSGALPVDQIEKVYARKKP